MAKLITPEQLAACGTEAGHQMALFAWAASQYNRWPQLRLMFHIQNASANKSARVMGVKEGVSDIFLPIAVAYYHLNGMPKGWYHGLFIELKKIGGKLDREGNQLQFGKDMVEQGYQWECCYGWQEARDAIVAYLSL